MTFDFRTVEQLTTILGERLRRLRIMRRMNQEELAERAGVSVRAIRDLENGRGSKVETLIRILKTLGYVEAFDAIAPDIGVDPMALLRRSKTPRRVRHERKEEQ
jgi:transcriptional regulator with XRE-family HTH domain